MRELKMSTWIIVGCVAGLLLALASACASDQPPQQGDFLVQHQPEQLTGGSVRSPLTLIASPRWAEIYYFQYEHLECVTGVSKIRSQPPTIWCQPINKEE